MAGAALSIVLLAGSDRFRVVVVSADAFARSGLALALACEVVEQLGDDGDLAGVVARDRPDAVLWDLGTGLLARRRLVGVDVPVVVLATDEEQASAAIAVGARGAVDRAADAERILPALKAVATGMVVVDEAFAGLVRTRDPADSPVEALTPRENEVLQLLAEGMSNKQIAVVLDISDHTAKFHVNAILGKLGADNRTEAVVRAAKQGLLVL